MKKLFLSVLVLSLLLSSVPPMQVFAWNMPFEAPPVISDPAFQFPALDNGEVVLNKTQGRLPALGWNSWNAFASSINEARIRGVADAFIYRGLDQVGYEYVVIDDGCYPSSRVDGRLTNNAAFASGFKAMSDYVHGLGLKFGMYNDVGVVTCANQAGLYGYEDVDAESFAEWDIDYIKVDYCGYLWDIGYRSAVAPNQQYVYAPRIRSVTISGGGLAAPVTFNAATDGIPINSPEVNTTGEGYVGRIGTDMSKYNSQLYLNRSIETPFWRELQFDVDVPSNGTYDMVVNYSTGNPARYTDETSVGVSTTGTRLGRWLQVAVGPVENEKRFFDDALPQTDFGTTQTYTYIDSPVIKVDFSAGENILRLMNHRREENALYSYAAFLDGLNKAGVGDKIILSVCDWGQTRPYHWAYKVGDSWRTSDDITLSVGTSGSASWGSGTTPSTSSIMGQYNKNVILDEYAGLDRGWNDPDMMVIGMSGINVTMAKSHMAMWCMMNSPIMLGFDITNDTTWEANKEVVLNADFLALNQDPLGIQSKRVYTSLALSTGDPSKEYITNANRIDIMAKPLANGDVALTFVNCGSGTNGAKSASIDADTIISYIGSKMADGSGNGFKNASRYIVTDLWTKGSTVNTTGTFSVTNLGITDTHTVRITPVTKEALSLLIASAVAELNEKVSSANPITPANADLAAAIEIAKLVDQNLTATDDQIQEAMVDLRGAINLFREAYAEQAALKGTISRANQVLADNAQHLNRISVRAAAEVFKAAIATADTALGNPALDKGGLTAANGVISAAINAFLDAVDNTTRKLKAPWYVVNPQAAGVTIDSSSGLTINTENGDFYQISATTTNRVRNIHIFDIENSESSIEITAELTFSPTQAYQTAGIMYFVDEYNMCSIVRRYHSGATPYNSFMSYRNTRSGSTGAASSSEQRFTDYAIQSPKCYLRIVKNGTTITGYYRESEDIEWRQAYAFTASNVINNAPVLRVGLYAANGSGSAASIPAKFENFRVNGVLQPFADDFISNIDDLAIETPLGSAPILPAKVIGSLSDGTQKEFDVVWDAIDAALYNNAGTFEVEGIVAEADLIITAHVRVFPSSIAILPGDDVAEAEFTVVAGGSPLGYQLILALYDGRGILEDVKIKTGNLGAGEWAKDKLEIGQPRGYTVRAFLWDSSYIPLIPSEEYEEPFDVDKSALIEAMEAVNALDINAYTRLSADKLISAMEAAAAVLIDGGASRVVVREAIEAIESAKGQLDIPTDIVKLSGEIYGRPGTYNNSTVNTIDKLFDGNTGTFFDSNVGDAAWVGIDLGEGNETYVYSFRYHPRSGQLGRMNGCTIRGSMTQTNGTVGTLLHTVEGVSAFQYYTAESNVKDQKFRYLWIQSGPEWWGNTSELEFYGRGTDADLSLLSDRIAYADALTAADYTAPSWATLQAALTPAKTLTVASTQAEVDTATTNLKAALAQLTPA